MDWEELRERVEMVDGVESAFPFTYNQAMLTTAAGARGMLIRGIGRDEASIEKLRGVLDTELDIESLFKQKEMTVIRPDGSYDRGLIHR